MFKLDPPPTNCKYSIKYPRNGLSLHAASGTSHRNGAIFAKIPSIVDMKCCKYSCLAQVLPVPHTYAFNISNKYLKYNTYSCLAIAYRWVKTRTIHIDPYWYTHMNWMLMSLRLLNLLKYSLILSLVDKHMD